MRCTCARVEVGHCAAERRVGGTLADQAEQLADEALDVHAAGGERDPLVGERGHRDPPAAVDVSDAQVVVHVHVVEEDLVEVGLAEHVTQRADGHALAVHREQEVGDALVTRAPARAREQHAVGGHLGAARPDLLTRDAPALAVALGAGLERGEIRARVRLGEQLAPDLLAGEDAGEEALLVLLAAEVDDRRPGEPLAEQVETVGRAHAVVLLQEDRLLGQRRVATAVPLRPRQPGVPRIEELPLELAEVGETLLGGGRLGPGERRDGSLEHAPGVGAELGVGGTVAEVHGATVPNFR